MGCSAIAADAGFDKLGTRKLLLQQRLQLSVERRKALPERIAFLVETRHRKRGRGGKSNQTERCLPGNKRRQRNVNESDNGAAKERQGEGECTGQSLTFGDDRVHHFAGLAIDHERPFGAHECAEQFQLTLRLVTPSKSDAPPIQPDGENHLRRRDRHDENENFACAMGADQRQTFLNHRVGNALRACRHNSDPV